VKEDLKTLLENSFGFNPEESTHHFVVNIARGENARVEISEHLTWDPKVGSSSVSYGLRQDGQIRVVLQRPRWDAIADEVRVVFNRRLRKSGFKTGNWHNGLNLVRRELGKELVLLAWAIEDADPGLIPNAIINWNGLVPEERWWLYTQTAAVTGHGTEGRNRGWRKALRYALSENPNNGGTTQPVPEYFRRAQEAPLFQAIRDEDDKTAPPAKPVENE